MEKFRLAKLVEKPSLDDRWYVEYNYRHPETGKFKSPAYRVFISQKIKTKTGRRKKGYDVVNEINAKLREGWNPFQNTEKRFTSIYKAMDFVLDYKEATIRPRSFQTYKNMITTFQRFLNEKEYANITCEEFAYYKAQEFMDWAMVTLKIKNRTYNNYVKHMRTFFHLLIKREYMSVNPFVKVDFLPEDEAEILCFTKDELELIKRTLPEYDPSLFLISQFIFYCFIRPTEQTRLRIQHVDMKKKIITIPGVSAKNGKQQSVVIPDQFYEILSLYRLERFPLHYFLVSKSLDPGNIQIAGQRISERWRKYANEYEIDPRKTIYHLKHTAVGMAVEKGINVRDLQLHLRHSSLEMTQIYIEKFNNIGGDTIRHNYPDF